LLTAYGVSVVVAEPLLDAAADGADVVDVVDVAGVVDLVGEVRGGVVAPVLAADEATDPELLQAAVTRTVAATAAIETPLIPKRT
jgi:acyl transferase domain-containing protein